MMKFDELFCALADRVDADRLMRDTEELWATEAAQTHRCQREAARWVERRLREAGGEQVERVVLPADGETVFQDKTMPLAWEVTDASLRIVGELRGLSDPVLADVRRHPFHVIKGSPGTPPGGVRTRLIREEDVYAGVDAQGAMVLLSEATRPMAEAYRAACDFRALGVVSGWLKHADRTPDGIQWVNAFTDGRHWHTLADDRPLMGFSISPRSAASLRVALAEGPLEVEVRSDARCFRSETDLVTGILPGRSRREVWLMAHLYEPMPDDNASGVAACLEILRAVRGLVRDGRLPRPRFTLRLFFGWELYGLAAYAVRRGGRRLDREVIGALNVDGMPLQDEPVTVHLAPAAAPFCGDAVMEALIEACAPRMRRDVTIDATGGYGDDRVLNDPMVGVKTVWIRGGRSMWHSSAQTMAVIDPASFARVTAVNAAWCALMLTLDRQRARALLPIAVERSVRRIAGGAPYACDAEGAEDSFQRAVRREQCRLRDFSRVMKGPELDAALDRLGEEAQRMTVQQGEARPRPRRDLSAVETMAAVLIPRRTDPGFPNDLRFVPKPVRAPRSDLSAYGDYGRILAAMDGRTNLLEAVRQAAWEAGKGVTDAMVRSAVAATEFLAEYGYLAVRSRRKVTRRGVAAALRRAGVRAGDRLFMHSGLSALGHVEGGPDAVIDGTLDVLGDKGVLLMPAFCRSFTHFDGVPVTGKRFRPFESEAPIFTGRIPAEFVRRPGVTRSRHPTHSVAGIGPGVDELLGRHGERDSPTGPSSPVGALHGLDAKIVWLGADVNSTTFLHFLEEEMDFPYLKSALCHVRRPDGRVDRILFSRHLPGHRDFYQQPGEQQKMFRRLFSMGLAMQRVPLGFGLVRVVRARALYTLGMQALRKEPDLLLCDRADCGFCADARRELRPAAGG